MLNPLKGTVAEVRSGWKCLFSARNFETVNTDQGSQFTSTKFVEALTEADINISADGKGACRYGVLVERLWPTIKDGEDRPHGANLCTEVLG